MQLTKVLCLQDFYLILCSFSSFPFNYILREISVSCRSICELQFNCDPTHVQSGIQAVTLVHRDIQLVMYST